jgi:ribonucleotide monophosphatase NagD (HAD superfamily)
LPGAVESLRLLKDNHVPFILLTNGGGKHESERTAELSELLDTEITEDMFLQSHTPFKSLVNRYKTILAIGGEEIGEGEGWSNDRIGRIGEGGVREVAER